MSVYEIGNLNIEMQNVMPAQAITPTEAPQEEVQRELGSDLPEEASSGDSRTSCSCVDTYA